MVVWIFVPSVVKYNISREVVRTFGENEKTFIVEELTNIIVYDYSNNKLISQVKKDIEERLESWFTETFKYDDEVYIVLVGGILQSVIAIRKLIELGIEFKFLVYEKKVDKYVILDGDTYEVVAPRTDGKIKLGYGVG